MTRLRPFQRSLFKAMRIHLLPKLSGNSSALTEVLANDLLGTDGPRRIATEHTQLEFDLWRLNQAYREVEKSVATLADIVIYVGPSQQVPAEIPPSRYLQFHAEAFVAEVYILRERLQVLLKVSKRQLRGLKSPHLNAHGLDELIAKVGTSLEPIVATRRKHTHEARLSEPTIERLDTISLLESFPEAGVQDLARKVQARATRDAFTALRRQVQVQVRLAKALLRESEVALQRALFFPGSPYLRRAEA